MILEVHIEGKSFILLYQIRGVGGSDPNVEKEFLFYRTLPLGNDATILYNVSILYLFDCLFIMWIQSTLTESNER